MNFWIDWYVNEFDSKFVGIYIPVYINYFQYESLCYLNEQLQNIQALNSGDLIKVYACNNDVNPNNLLEILEDIDWCEEKNNLSAALEYYENYIVDIDLEKFPRYENILNLEKNYRR